MTEKEIWKLFVQAEQFYRAGKLLARFTLLGRDLGFSAVVCDVFSTELFFKCLIAVEGNDPPQWHDLKNLFDRVSGENQLKVRQYFEPYLHEVKKFINVSHTFQGTPAPTVDFDFVLERGRDMFRVIRYVHEDKWQKGTGWMGGRILESTRKVILELRPDLADSRSDRGAIDLDTLST